MFSYMRQSFNLDGLVDYRTDNVPETIVVVNPTARLMGRYEKKVALLNRIIAKFGAINLRVEIEPAKVETYAQRKADLQEFITRPEK